MDTETLQFGQAAIAEPEPAHADANKYRQLIDNCPEWLWEVDVLGVMAFSNGKVRNVLGYRPEEVVGHRLTEYMLEDDAQRMREILASPISPDDGRRFEAVFWRKDGGETQLELNLIPAFDTSGRMTGYEGVAQNITARKHAEEERERLVRKLQAAVLESKMLHGLLPICASCKKIRDDHGDWNVLELYLRSHADVTFTHSLCPECLKKYWDPVS